MTDIFFSYSSADRERLVAQGFEVFWDQEVPTGLDWDSWIRQHLTKTKCAMAFWSMASVASSLKSPPQQHGRLEFEEFCRALEKLLPDQREALILVGASGFSYEEAAAICEASILNVEDNERCQRLTAAIWALKRA